MFNPFKKKTKPAPVLENKPETPNLRELFRSAHEKGVEAIQAAAPAGSQISTAAMNIFNNYTTLQMPATPLVPVPPVRPAYSPPAPPVRPPINSNPANAPGTTSVNTTNPPNPPPRRRRTPPKKHHEANTTGSQGVNTTGSQRVNTTGSQGVNTTGSQGVNTTGSQGVNATGVHMATPLVSNTSGAQANTSSINQQIDNIIPETLKNPPNNRDLINKYKDLRFYLEIIFKSRNIDKTGKLEFILYDTPRFNTMISYKQNSTENGIVSQVFNKNVKYEDILHAAIYSFIWNFIEINYSENSENSEYAQLEKLYNEYLEEDRKKRDKRNPNLSISPQIKPVGLLTYEKQLFPFECQIVINTLINLTQTETKNHLSKKTTELIKKTHEFIIKNLFYWLDSLTQSRYLHEAKQIIEKCIENSKDYEDIQNIYKEFYEFTNQQISDPKSKKIDAYKTMHALLEALNISSAEPRESMKRTQQNSETSPLEKIIEHQKQRFDDLTKILTEHPNIKVIIESIDGQNHSLVNEKMAIEKFTPLKENLDTLVRQLQATFGTRISLGKVGEFVPGNRECAGLDKKNIPTWNLIHVWGANVRNFNTQNEAIVNTNKCFMNQKPGVFGVVTDIPKKESDLNLLDLPSNYVIGAPQADIGTMAATQEQADIGTMAATQEQADIGTMAATQEQADIGTMAATQEQADIGTMAATQEQAANETMAANKLNSNVIAVKTSGNSATQDASVAQSPSSNNIGEPIQAENKFQLVNYGTQTEFTIPKATQKVNKEAAAKKPSPQQGTQTPHAKKPAKEAEKESTEEAANETTAKSVINPKSSAEEATPEQKYNILENTKKELKKKAETIYEIIKLVPNYDDRHDEKLEINGETKTIMEWIDINNKIVSDLEKIRAQQAKLGYKPAKGKKKLSKSKQTTEQNTSGAAAENTSSQQRTQTPYPKKQQEQEQQLTPEDADLEAELAALLAETGESGAAEGATDEAAAANESEPMTEEKLEKLEAEIPDEKSTIEQTTALPIYTQLSQLEKIAFLTRNLLRKSKTLNKTNEELGKWEKLYKSPKLQNKEQKKEALERKIANLSATKLKLMSEVEWIKGKMAELAPQQQEEEQHKSSKKGKSKAKGGALSGGKLRTSSRSHKYKSPSSNNKKGKYKTLKIRK